MKSVLLSIIFLFCTSCSSVGSTAEGALLYVPNRVFDLVDIVRARARVGPGAAISIRATDVVDLNLGAYTTVYAGLPGPRREPTIPLPVFLEVLAVAEVGLLGVSTGMGFGPDYSPTEFGLGIHAALIGIDIGVDPIEFADFILGFLTIDLREDDF